MMPAAWPLGYLQTHGPRADPATDLTWGLLWISVAVAGIVTVLVVAGVMLRAVDARKALPGVERGPDALAWLTVGFGLTLVVLVVSLVWTVDVLGRIDSPPTRPALTIEVIGHQWWWEVRYLSPDPGKTFSTANEIHIPVGRPIVVRLQSADVIHSFWAPALTGKTDTIPGQTNLSWLQADRPGVYFGQCTEYCGAQHAHMALTVVAQTPAAFARWQNDQIGLAASVPPAGLPTAGATVFASHCGNCHTVRGTESGGILGPDLTHLMSRKTIASAMLPNDPGSLAGWIANPQALKPGTRMPATQLTGPELNAVTAYLRTLQ